MDEFHMKPVQYINGEFIEVEPRSEGITVQYPNPIGEQWAYYLMHSEQGTIVDSFKDKGLRTCTYRIGFPDETLDKLKFLHQLGFSHQDTINFEGSEIKPVKILKKLMESQGKQKEEVFTDESTFNGGRWPGRSGSFDNGKRR